MMIYYLFKSGTCHCCPSVRLQITFLLFTSSLFAAIRNEAFADQLTLLPPPRLLRPPTAETFVSSPSVASSAKSSRCPDRSWRSPAKALSWPSLFTCRCRFPETRTSGSRFSAWPRKIRSTRSRRSSRSRCRRSRRSHGSASPTRTT